MIEVEVLRDDTGKLKVLTVSGHAGYADFGKDIVCAGVSVLVETCILGLRKVAGIKPEVIKKQGYFLMKLPEKILEEPFKNADIILETTLIGLKDLAKTYPDYIKIRTMKEGRK